MRRLLTLSILVHLCSVCFSQDDRIPVNINRPVKFKIIGELGIKMGDTITVRGIVVQGPYKGNKGGPNLVIQTIRDSSIQQRIQIPISPYFGKFGDSLPFGKIHLPKLVYGNTYQFLVYETGGYVGRPNDAYMKSGIISQSTGFYFQNRLIVVTGKEIDSIVWSPANFLEKDAFLSGIANNESDTAVIMNPKWKLKLLGFRKWNDWEIGKQAAAYGKIHQIVVADTYAIETGWANLINLEDQLGKSVRLRGTAWSMNGNWWFSYRGKDIYVDKMDDLVRGKGELHGSPVEITGKLGQEELPDLFNNRKLKLYYIIKTASLTPIKELLTPELTFKEDED